MTTGGAATATVAELCAAQPGFTGATAYTRTKICCQVLTENGDPIPNWMALREIIGKGSSTDINRGIKDFRSEHGERLRQMRDVPAGMPAHLSPLIANLWHAAVDVARKELDAKASEWLALIQQADASAEQAANDLEAAEAQTLAAQAELATAAETIRGLERQLDTERGSREQAERLLRENTDEVAAQRDKMEALLSETKAEMAGALVRFDGERKYALSQIEEARRKAATDIANYKASEARERNELELSLVRSKSMEASLRAGLTEAQNRTTALAREVDELRARLARAADAARPDAHTSTAARPIGRLRRGVPIKKSLR